MVKVLCRNWRFPLKRNQSPGHSHKITDWAKFRAFVKVHGDKTQAQMAQLWEDKISARTISRGLQKIGLTRKKRPMVIKNETSANAVCLLLR